jgi:hypothetical protein
MTNEVSDIELTFLRRVVAWEEGPFTTHRDWLARRGHTFRPLSEVDPAQLAGEMWRLIRALATARVFLENTDHLSDAELYVQLTTDVLDADAPDFARTKADAFHWDFADPSGRGLENWLTYYASDDERDEWEQEALNSSLPPRKQPPFDRDRKLPGRD